MTPALITPSDLAAAGVIVQPETPPEGYTPPAGSLTFAAALALCHRATAEAERHCGRPLARASYDQVLPRIGPNRVGSVSAVRLKAWPVVALDALQGDRLDVLTIRATMTSWSATATLGPTTLTLKLGSTVATIDTVDATLAEIAAAVNATDGWRATVADGCGPCPVAELLPARVSLGALGPGARFHVYRADLSGHFDLDPVMGRLFERPSYFRDRGQLGDVRVRYTAGYNADPDAGDVDVPPDLARAVVLIAQADGQLAQASAAVKQATLGNSAYTLRDAAELAAVPAPAAKLLSPFLNRRL